jgi:hypothetical protein
MQTPKEELLWLEEFAGLDEAQDKSLMWIDFCNKRYLHMALGYKSPQEYERLYRETNLKKANRYYTNMASKMPRILRSIT